MITLVNQVTLVGGNNMQGSSAWLIQPTAAIINPTWSFSASTQVAVSSAAFLAAVVTPPSSGGEKTYLSVGLG